MKVSALLTSAGINIAICAVLLSLYSVLRMQPGNLYVYFGRRIAQEREKHNNPFSFERLVPSPGWIVKAWEYSENDILSVAGLDAVVFIRILVFSIRIFSIAGLVCLFGVLPSHYYGQDEPHLRFSSESLDAFSIANVKEGSRWLWVHCLALYIISVSACILLYYEYKNISEMRLEHLRRSSPNPRQFTVLVRAIPNSTEKQFSDSVKKFFSNYHASSYLSHQMVYRMGKVQEFMDGAEKVYRRFIGFKDVAVEQRCMPIRARCGLCGGSSNSFHLYQNVRLDAKNRNLERADSSVKRKCSAALVFFKTRYAAIVASEVLQSSNPMLWVTNMAPEPHDIYWSNLGIPYRQLWIRRIATLLAAIVFMFVFILPVTFVQGLSQLEQLQQRLPFLRKMLK